MGALLALRGQDQNMEGQIDGLIQQVVKDIREVVGQRRGTGKTPGVSMHDQHGGIGYPNP